MFNPRIVILKEGVDSSQGKGQLLSNINACEAVCEILKTTLGPRGMDKLIHDGGKVTISNDGATIIKLLDIVHPAAKTLVDIAKSQDDEVGDGTTSVSLFAGELLRSVKTFIEDGVHPQVIIKGFKLAERFLQKKLRELSVKVDKKDPKATREMLLRCGGTALNSKLIAGQKDFFSAMVVDSILHLDPSFLDLKLIGIKKVPGGSVTDSFLVEGVAFKKTFAYAGFEQQPKAFENPLILVLNVELELKSEATNAEVRISDPQQYQSIVDAEWQIIYEKLDKIVKSGAKIVLSKLPIGDLATQFFADRDIFCAGRVPADDLERVALATGAKMQTSLEDLSSSILGSCANFEEKQIGTERYNIFKGCPKAKTVSIVLRGGSDQYIAETERSLHDALMIVKRAFAHSQVVGGGGAIEMELSRSLKAYANTIETKHQMIINAFAKALEVIPRLLSENAGFDSAIVVNKLRAKHAEEGQDEEIEIELEDGKKEKITVSKNRWYGVDIENEDIINTFDAFIWEPTLVKQQALAAATEAACIILSIDETVKHPQSEGLNDDRVVPPPRR